MFSGPDGRFISFSTEWAAPFQFPLAARASISDKLWPKSCWKTLGDSVRLLDEIWDLEGAKNPPLDISAWQKVGFVSQRSPFS